MLADEMPDTERTDRGSTARERIGRALDRLLDETRVMLEDEIERVRAKSDPPPPSDTLPSASMH